MMSNLWQLVTIAIELCINIITSNIDEGEQLAKEVSVGPEIVMF